MGDFSEVRTFISAQSPQDAAANASHWAPHITQFESILTKETQLGLGSERAVAQAVQRNALLARSRIELILDQDSPFLELCTLAGNNMADENSSSGGSVVAGIGLVCGTLVMVSAHVPTLRGGSITPVTLKKSQRLGEIARENRLPIVTMVQSGGADLTQQFQVFHEGGGAFREPTRRSREKMPSITVVFGSSTAGGAYTPGMSDYVVMVDKKAQVYLAGPPLVKMATGEDVGHEELGGAAMHSSVSGVSDFLACDEMHGIKMARDIVASLNYKREEMFPGDDPSVIVAEPLYSPESMLEVVPPSIREPYDVREVIARIVDGSRFSQFKEEYGTTLVCAFARLHGAPIGILANNGVLFSEASQKGAQFIQLCNQSNTPLLFLQNITGFMVGKRYEQEGIIKNGAKLINAVSNSDVPAITVVLGASYGAGNYGMSGRAYRPRFLFSWPTSRCSVMGPEQLGGVLDIVARQAAASRGIEFTPEMEQMAGERKAALMEQVERQSDVYYTSARCLDDGIIDPRDTRTIVGMALNVCYNTKVEGSMSWGVFRM